MRYLTEVVTLRVGWHGYYDGRTLPEFTERSVEPEPAYPVGRKGLLLAAAWKQLSRPNSDGMLINDGDVVLEPTDFLTLTEQASREPEAVWTAPVKLWPKSTNLPGWVWGHRKYLPDGTPLALRMAAGQADIDDPDMFTFGFTWIPRRLVEASIENGLETWIFPKVDTGMWQTAAELGIPVRVVRGDCHPRHTNW